jgi:hypothetical protein
VPYQHHRKLAAQRGQRRSEQSVVSAYRPSHDYQQASGQSPEACMIVDDEDTQRHNFDGGTSGITHMSTIPSK